MHNKRMEIGDCVHMGGGISKIVALNRTKGLFKINLFSEFSGKIKDYKYIINDWPGHGSGLPSEYWAIVLPTEQELKEKHKKEGWEVEKSKVYYCCLCHKNAVDALNGFDTCDECLNKQ